MSTTMPGERIAGAPPYDSLKLLALKTNLQTLLGAVLAVLLLRVLCGAMALTISLAMPQNPLEERVGLAPGGASLGEWLQRLLVSPWMRYDALNYQRIVEYGPSLEQGTAAFHPFYSLLARPFALLLAGNSALALLIVSTLATITLTLLFARYTAQIHGKELVTPATWLLLITPPSFILLAPYTESTFLVLAVASLWAMHNRRWWLAGLLGGLAALTRQQGLALALPLLYLLLADLWARLAPERAALGRGALLRRALPGLGRAAVLTGLIPLGYLTYVVFRVMALGEQIDLSSDQNLAELIYGLLVSSSAEKVVQGQRIDWPWVLLFDQIGLILAKPWRYELYIDLILGWALVLAAIFSMARMTMAERLYCVGILALSLCYYNGTRFPYLALPRHMILAFPLYIGMARQLSHPRVYHLALNLFFALNLFLAGAFARRGWVP